MEEKKGFGDIYNSTGNADDVKTDVTEGVDSAEFVDQDNLNDYDNTAEAATEDVDDTFDEAAYEEKILYRNNFEYTTPLLKELYKGVLKWDKARRVNSIFIYCILAANVVANIIFAIMGETRLLQLLIISMVLLGALSAFKLLEPTILAKQTLSGYHRRIGEHMICETAFSEDEFTMEDVTLNQGKHYSYEEITRVRETETFVVLQIGKKEVIPIHKSQFTKGTLEGFRPFLIKQLRPE